jgi:hypothetical protein
VVDKDNGGRSDALNAAIDHARSPLVCCVDADSLLEADALLVLVRPFIERPDRTVAAGGLIRVANGSRIERGHVVRARLPRRVLPMFQTVEYLRAFTAARCGWSLLNGLLIISGPSGCSARTRWSTRAASRRTPSARTSNSSSGCTGGCASCAARTGSSSSPSRCAGRRSPSACASSAASATGGIAA